MSDTPANPAPVQPPTAFGLDQVQVPAQLRPSRHKFGHGAHDLAELNAKLIEKADKLANMTLDRLEAELHKLPLTYLPVAAAIFLDKRRDLLAVPSMAMSQTNTVIINGFSRSDAVSFLKGELKPELERNGFVESFAVTQDQKETSLAHDVSTDLRPAPQLSTKTP